MKKQLIVFLFSLIPLIGSSQTLTLNTIQKESLKTDTTKVLALILAEHAKLSAETPLLKQKITALEELNSICEESNKIKDNEIEIYKEKINSDAIKINKLKNTTIIGTTIVGVLSLIIGIIL